MPEKDWWKELENKAAQRAYVDIVGGAVQLQLVRRATIPLLVHRRGHAAPELLASGVLLALGGRVFILTAAHIIESLGRNVLCFELDDRVVKISHEGYRTPLPKTRTYVDDPVDAAVFPVPPECIASLLSRCAKLGDLCPVDNAYDVAYV